MRTIQILCGAVTALALAFFATAFHDGPPVGHNDGISNVSNVQLNQVLDLAVDGTVSSPLIRAEHAITATDGFSELISDWHLVSSYDGIARCGPTAGATNVITKTARDCLSNHYGASPGSGSNAIYYEHLFASAGLDHAPNLALASSPPGLTG